MPFFLPGRLINLEYFKNDKPDEDYLREAKPYQKDMDFAFFAANFGFSKSDYENLTPREISFLYKAYEDKIVSHSYMLYNAFFTALYNVNRPKHKKALKLWKKGRTQIRDKNEAEKTMQIVKETERNDGNWIERLYKANKIKLPKGG